ncbi:MurR/RpiR family transcriptional regulator [Amaricoccus sp.]|uniref:MurR/RpiR family transcriptional regulator n=1 Tax=Amaricoccus sp. TaxID=1872485 RepID=UPI001B6FCD99|nr:MurR/RpiR family transcriptional regulator [Amaricoccus sp.]MBP7241017.1 MurR/RpiR family transcriptional regulator [Amaricoccus sp.]
MDIFGALTDEENRLSGLEKQLAQVILADVEFAVNASIVDLAERAEVSPPTVTRFCRRLGCQGYADFKLQLARSSFVGLRYLRPESEGKTPATVAEDIVTKAQNALYQMHQALDIAAVEKAATTLRAAGMIHAFGSGGNSSMIVNELQNRLFRLGCRISASSDHAMNLMIAAASGPGDVVFCSSFSGRNAELVHCLGVLRERGTPTIALTQSGSPVAQATDLVIGVDLPEGLNIFRPTSTRFACLAVIDIVATLVAYADRPRSTHVLRGIKEQLVRHRDKDDRQILGD